jgi:histidine ammonia-lyase
MTVVVNVRSDFTLDNFCRVAWCGEAVTIGPHARACMTEARTNFLALLESDPGAFVYGVTHRGGEHVRSRITPQERGSIGSAPDYGSSLTFGRPLPPRVVRGILFARLVNFVEGNAAVRPALADAVAALLDNGPLPTISLEGNGGAGEIMALGSLLAEIGSRLPLEVKERGALANGSPCAAALVTDAAIAGRRRLELVHRTFALSVEAFLAPTEAFKRELEGLWGDEHEIEALRTLRADLEGGSTRRRAVQAPVSYRILPRVLGHARRAVAAAERAAQTSLSSVTDNPVYVPGDDEHPLGQVFSTGGYHNAMAYPALDGLAAAWADLAQLAERHVVGILAEEAAWAPAPRGADIHHNLMVLPMVCVGYSESARRAAQRVFLPASSGGLAQDDVAAPTFFAWDGERQAGQALDANLAILACVACEALRASGREATPALQGLHAKVQELLPPVDETRPLNQGLECVTRTFASEVFGDAA